MAEGNMTVEELRKAQAAAQAQGSSITNYEQWASILEDFEVAGVQSTGNYAGDVKLHDQIMKQIEQLAEQVKAEQDAQEIQPQNYEAEKVDNKTQQDKEQVVKANVVNATSSVIMADYMKYYHLLH